MAEDYTPSPRADKVADWLERTALRTGVAMGAAPLRLAGAGAGLSDTDVALGLQTMGRRSRLLGQAYPFRTGSGIAVRDGADGSPWTALLLMSAESPLRAGVDLQSVAVHLERITAAALRQLYGAQTRSLRFGWPSDDGRPMAFGDAVRWLAERMNVAPGTAYRPPYAKDGGVDVVAWRPFSDGRSGFPVMLVQCTLERDYAHKANDVDLPVWAGYLRLDVPPTTGLAVPEVVAAGESWNGLAARTVVLDRLRLCSLLDGGDGADHSLDPVLAWTLEAVQSLRDDS